MCISFFVLLICIQQLCQKADGLSYPVAKAASSFNEETDGSITLTYEPVKFTDLYTRYSESP